MRPIAVAPIAIPIRARRTSGSGSMPRTGDCGYSSNVPKAAAEIMNSARPTASIKYSGQCPWTASIAPDAIARSTSSAFGKTGIEGHAAVDEQRRADDIIGIVGSEPHDRPRDILGLADPLVGHQGHQLGVGRFCTPGRGIDRCPN